MDQRNGQGSSEEFFFSINITKGEATKGDSGTTQGVSQTSEKARIC